MITESRSGRADRVGGIQTPAGQVRERSGYGFVTVSRMKTLGFPLIGTLKSCRLPLPVSVNGSQLPTSSVEDLRRSIQDVVMTLPDETTIYPGHGPTSTIGDERRTNPFVVRGF